MACGMNHALAWDDNGEIYAWGDCSYNKLGIPRIRKASGKFLEQPEKIDFFAKKNIVMASCGE